MPLYHGLPPRPRPHTGSRRTREVRTSQVPLCSRNERLEQAQSDEPADHRTGNISARLTLVPKDVVHGGSGACCCGRSGSASRTTRSAQYPAGSSSARLESDSTDTRPQAWKIRRVVFRTTSFSGKAFLRSVVMIRVHAGAARSTNDAADAY